MLVKTGRARLNLEGGLKPISFEVVQNDSKSNKLTIYLTGNDIPYPLTDISDVFILFKKPDETVVQGRCSIVDRNASIVEYTLGTNEISVIGQIIGTVFITDAEGSRLTFSEFTFNVREDLTGNGTVESTTEFHVLTELIARVEAMDTQANHYHMNMDVLNALSDDNGVLEYNGQPIQGSGGTADSIAWSNVTGKPVFATVATSGSYNDLSNRPTIPSVLSGDVTTHYHSADRNWNNITNKPTIPADTNQLAKTDVYTKTEVDNIVANVSSGGTVDLTNYYNKTETYNKTEIDTQLNDIVNQIGTGNVPENIILFEDFVVGETVEIDTPDTSAPTVTTSPSGGTYGSIRTVTLTANETSTIYYTLDGTIPTTSSNVYSSALTISSTTTIRYFAIDTAGNQSAVQSATYTIDTVAPNNVTNLSTSNITANSLTLSWTASTSSDVSGYDIYRGATFLATVAETTYNISGLTASTSYTFSVRTRDAVGNIASGISTTITTSSVVDTTAPNNVTNLTSSNLTSTSLTLLWTASTSSDVASYDVYNGGTLLGNTTSTSYNVTGLTASTQYTFGVRAKDGSGNVATGTNVTITTSAPSDTTAPTVTASPAGGTYASTQTVTLTANETSTIYYTLDGSTPTTLSTVYSAPISISSTKTLKFFGKDTAGNSSTVQSATYTINTFDANGKTVTITGTKYGGFNLTMLVPYDSDFSNGKSIVASLSANSVTNVLQNTATNVDIFGDNTGILANSAYTVTVSTHGTATVTVSDNVLSANINWTINTNPTTTYLKIPIFLSVQNTPASFVITSLTLTANGVTKNIIGLGGFFTEETSTLT